MSKRGTSNGKRMREAFKEIERHHARRERELAAKRKKRAKLAARQHKPMLSLPSQERILA